MSQPISGRKTLAPTAPRWARQLGLAALAAFVTAGGAAQAGPTVVVEDASVTSNIPVCCTTTGLTSAAENGFTWSASGNNGNPSITAFGNTYIGANGNDTGGGGFATLNYFYEITGGKAGVYVPLEITGEVSAGGAIDSTSEASINYANGGVDTKNFGPGVIEAIGQILPTESFPETLDLDTTYDVLSGVQLEITMFVTVAASTGGHNLSSDSFAMADPTLSLSPADLAAGYSIVLSPNLLAGVPEPASWALMIGGFGLTGAALRRRRATSPSAG
jgi:hypothetical protein